MGTPIGSARMPGATNEAPPDPPAEIMPTMSPWRRSQLVEGLRHRRHRSAAIRAEHRAAAAGVIKGDFLGGDVAGRSLPAVETSTRRVRSPLPAHDVADESEFLALGIQRADDEHGRPSGASRCFRVAARSRGLLEPQHTGRERTGAGLDARDRHRLRPSGRRRRIGNVDADRCRALRARGSRLSRTLVLGLRANLDLGFGVTSDAEQALLQVAIGGQPRASR